MDHQPDGYCPNSRPMHAFWSVRQSPLKRESQKVDYVSARKADEDRRTRSSGRLSWISTGGVHDGLNVSCKGRGCQPRGYKIVGAMCFGVLLPDAITGGPIGESQAWCEDYDSRSGWQTIRRSHTHPSELGVSSRIHGRLQHTHVEDLIPTSKDYARRVVAPCATPVLLVAASLPSGASVARGGS